MYKQRRRTFVRLASFVFAVSSTVFLSAGLLRVSPPILLASTGAFFASPFAAVRTAQEVFTTENTTPAAAVQSTPTQEVQAPAESGQTQADSAAPAAENTPAAAPASTGEPLEARSPVAGEAVPEGMVPLLEQHFQASAGTGYIPTGTALIRNSTSLPDGEVAAEVGQPLPFSVEVNSSQPQVLIMHTHATECYESTEHSYTDPAFSARTTDTAVNMVAVGQQMTDILNAAGINTLHDTTLHDYPSYTGSYEKSNATVRSYLQQYPSIKVVIDVHRDAIQQADGTRVKPVVTINGEKSAQVMLISCADQDGNLPNYKQNLRFAAAWQAQMEGMFPGLTRPVLFDYRYYNQDLTTGSLLIEVGGHANTLSEAMAAGRMAAQALAKLFTGA